MKPDVQRRLKLCDQGYRVFFFLTVQHPVILRKRVFLRNRRHERYQEAVRDVFSAVEK